MNRAEFKRLTRVYSDRQAPAIRARYSLGHPGERYTLKRREAATLTLLRRHGMSALQAARILDLGCGRGHRLADWVRWGAMPENLAGIDIIEGFAREARATMPAAMIAVASGDQLPFPSDTFDIVAQATVFTSILDRELRRHIAAEMRRVVKRGGLILWYDFRVGNPRNRDVSAIGRAELGRLFPGCSIDRRSVTLARPIARALGQSVFAVGGLLEALPFLRTHYLAAIRRS